MAEFFKELFGNIIHLFTSFTISDFLDICLVALLVYTVIVFIRQTRAIQLVKGMLFLGAVYMLIRLLHMQVSTYIMSRIFADAVLVLLLLFQPEIRHALESMGRQKIGYRNKNDTYNDLVYEVSKACSDMSDKKIGALIVIEKESLLGDIIASGCSIDAIVSSEMLCNIFYPKAPLHDGAAVISGNRIVSAGCILPLTQNNLSSDLGTRHRAAVGLSEQSDAVIIVVSEETGAISVATGGYLRRDISHGALREMLMKEISSDGRANSILRTLFGGKKNG